ncbi:MAG: 3-oxoadipate enol-lactonase [Acidobacteriia bacterium]|nr:3-oxoadipate enol-lactonase [Terriglobia bacterium]
MPFVDVGELRTHYELTGDREPVLVFSNSLGTDFSMWDPQMAELGRRFRILRNDTRGHGRSSVTPGEYTIEQLGRDVLGLLDALHLDRVHFCGLSMGGMIGMWLGIHAPNRLHRLVLCNTAARIGTQEMWNARIATVRKDGMKPVAASVIERWFTPGFRASCQEKVARAQHMLENAPPEGYAACCAAIRDMDQREAVAQIKAPTLVIYGGSDPVTPASDAHFLKDRIPGAAEVELPAAHLSNVEQADAFTEAVRHFLSR